MTARLLRLRTNAIIAFVLTLIIGGAATGVVAGGDSAIHQALPWKNPLFANLYFVLYRLSYLVLLFVCLLHMTIAFQLIWSKVVSEHSRLRERQISRYFYVTVLFMLVAIAVEFTVWHLTMGEMDWKAAYGNALQFALVLFIVIMFVGLFFALEPEPRKPIGEEIPTGIPKSEKELMEAVKALPRYTLLPLAFLVVPLASFCISVSFSGETRNTKWNELRTTSGLSEYMRALNGFVKEQYSEKITRKFVAVDMVIRSETHEDHPRLKDILPLGRELFDRPEGKVATRVFTEARKLFGTDARDRSRAGNQEASDTGD